MGKRWQNALAWLGIGDFAPDEGETFSETAPRPIDQVLYEMRAGNPVRISRAEALSVPAVLRGRNLICSISTLPLVQVDAMNKPARLPLLEQIDQDVANVVTLSQTVEDLLFEGIAWWRITGKDAAGYPTSARHLAPGTVSLVPPTGAVNPLPSETDPRGGVVWVDGVQTPGNWVIRFDSPNPGLLKSGARAVRRALRLDEAAAMYADEPDASGYFVPTEGADPVDDDDVEEILDDWHASRKKRKTGYVPAAMKYETVDRANPAELQLIDQQKRGDLALANALGLDPEDLGVSTTSRTYNNATDRRKDRINDVLSPYMKAITDRLSMGDVTKRGYLVRFDVDDYLRADPVSRVAYYKGMKDMGAMTAEEIRTEEGLPEQPAAGVLAPVVPLQPADVSRETSVAAAGDQPMRFDSAAAVELPISYGFAVDTGARTVTGLCLPYGQIAAKFGRRWRFEQGSLSWEDVGRVKLLRDHNNAMPIGRAISLTDTPAGLFGVFRIARGAEGDQVLALAEDGVLDGLSVGAEFDASGYGPDPQNPGVSLVRRGILREVTMTAMPAFDSARLTSVAATADQGREPMSTQQTPAATPPAAPPPQQQFQQQQAWQMPAQPQPQQFAPQQFQQQAPQLQAAPPAPQPQQWTPEQLAQFQQFQQFAGQQYPPQPMAWQLLQHAGGQPPADQGPQLVNPNPPGGATFEVTEPAPYRFDRLGNIHRGSHEFSVDLISAGKGDQAAADRAIAFVGEAFERANFDVATTDVNELNPTRQRPEMYVDQKSFRYPIWDAINKGSLTDITPFTFPKFSSASGLVGAHTEGVEPTSGTMVTTSQTVNPTAVSGKAKITRETWDQGGNPQISNLIWRQMVKGWYEALEAAAVTLLDAASPTQIDFSGTPGLDNDDLDQAITGAFTDLQFIRGGFTMDNMFTQIDLYKALSAATDSAGRRLYPALGPTNAMGQMGRRFQSLDINGVVALPAWALAATGLVPASSYLFDAADVHGWATAPQRLEFNIEVAHVYIGIWGYKATAISDITGVREIVYDPA